MSQQQPRQLPPFGWYGAAIPTTFQTSAGFPIATLTIFNNSPAALTVFPTLPPVLKTGLFPWGGIVVPAWYPMNLQVSDWAGFAFATDGTAPFANSSLTITASEAQGGVPLSPLGPSAWAAGSVPNTIQNVNPGDQFFAWQVQQLIDLVTGSIHGQGVWIATNSQYVLQLEFLTFPNTRIYGLSGDSSGNFILDDVLAVARRLTIFTDGGMCVGIVPVDPGPFGLSVQGLVTGAGGSKSVTGSRGGNAALASLLTQLATIGLIVDNTTV